MEKMFFLVIFIYLIFNSNNLCANLLDNQRCIYQKIEAALDKHQIFLANQLLPLLKKYPLYSYLKYRLFILGLANETVSNVRKFIKNNSSVLLLKELISNFTDILVSRKDWKGILRFFSKPPNSLKLCCNWYYAKWMTGDKKIAFYGAKKIWLKDKFLPGDCDKLFSVWKKFGKIAPELVFFRVALAIKKGDKKLIADLLKYLSPNYHNIANNIMHFKKDFLPFRNFFNFIIPKDIMRAEMFNSFSYLGIQNFRKSRDMIESLWNKRKINRLEAKKLKEILVWYMMEKKLNSDDAHWCDKIIKNSRLTILIERRIRLALLKHNYDEVNFWINSLSEEAKKSYKWQYWKADYYYVKGYKKKANLIFSKLMRKTNNFYSMVAAQQLGKQYVLLNKSEKIEKIWIVSKTEELNRIREFMYWGLHQFAFSEWICLLKNKTFFQRRVFAIYANDQKWWNLSVQASIMANKQSNIKERFPLAWKKFFQYFTFNKSIPFSYAMAIARQESAWNPMARSLIGAIGLMQVLPDTAFDMVKMYKIDCFSNINQLFEPKVNIQIGTRYLEYLYKKFSKNRIFSSAAYNAGPSRVCIWKNHTSGRLNPIEFIETIPFEETREYVKNILIYNFYYRYLLTGKFGKILNDNEWNQRY